MSSQPEGKESLYTHISKLTWLTKARDIGGLQEASLIAA